MREGKLLYITFRIIELYAGEKDFYNNAICISI